MSNTAPFITWPGGKRQLIKEYTKYFPREYNTYFEPFLGGGAVLFHLEPQKAIINDANKELINIYIQIKHNAGAVIEIFNNLNSRHCDREYYLAVRKEYNKIQEYKPLSIESAGTLLWLSRYGFNGLYRVNKKGAYNVPYNNKTCERIDEENIKRVGEYLRGNNIQIISADFEVALQNAQKGDFVFLDPPYYPESKTANFTSYTRERFSERDNMRLAVLVKKMTDRGVLIMLSNNDVPFYRELYWDYNIIGIEALRVINRNGQLRKGKELIITNY